MKRKNKIIISLFIFAIVAIAVICIILSLNYKTSNVKESQNHTNEVSKKHSASIKKKSDKIINDTKKNSNIKTNSKTNVLIKNDSNTHNHNWKELGYYAEESGWAGAEEVSEICKEVNCSYICKICDKCDMYRDDIKSVNDLRNHLKECTYDRTPVINVDSMTDQEVMSNFLVCKQITSKVYIKNGYKCSICGKKITEQEAYELGIVK